MITITGATGQLGSAVVDFLIQKGVDPSNIAALARSEEKAQTLKAKGVHVNIGSYDAYDAMVSAFTGTDKLLFISGSDMEKREAQHLNVVRAAQEAGVKHVIYTSFQRQSEGPDSPLAFVLHAHLATEQALKASGMQYTILRNNLYMDMLPMILGENVFETGIFYPVQEGRVAFTLRSDLAEATANVLIGEHHENKEYNFSSAHSLTFFEVADYLSSVAGKPVNYISPSIDEYKGALTAAGVPEMAVGMMSFFAIAIAQDELVAGDTDLPRLLGREAVNFKDFLNGMYAQQ